jgi:hypothetical protein
MFEPFTSRTGAGFTTEQDAVLQHEVVLRRAEMPQMLDGGKLQIRNW